MKSERRLLTTGIAGTIVAAVCCFTPALVILLGVIGLSAWLAWLDFVLFPALAIFIVVTIYAGVRILRARNEPVTQNSDQP